MNNFRDSSDRYSTLAIMLAVLLLSGVLSVGNSAVAGEASPMQQMAEIMHRLKHYPSPLGKEVLQKIVASDSTSAHQRTLATAMMNLEHKVSPQDVSKLKALMADAPASADEKTLADIILNLNHRPTKQDKMRVKAMMH
ncbi:MAG: hypothetical protein GXP17_07430 [Gammaproteobacteria bacterium]|nr:hypothetical protein [Gammaproteobacteria bacterium]